MGNIGSIFGYKELLSHPTFSNALAVISEGEDALTEIVKVAMEHQQDITDVSFYSDITNVAVSINGEIFLNSARRVDLEKYPSHSISNPSDIYDEEWDVYAIETSRGCPWGKCTFCSIRSQFSGCDNSKHGNNHDWRPFPVDVILGNIERFSAKGVRNIDIKDSEFFGTIRSEKGHDYFNKTMQRAEEFAKGIIEINKKLKRGRRSDDKITINHISARIDAIYKSGEHEKNQRRKEVFNLLKDAGVKGVYLGIESGSPDQLKRYNKGVTVEENKEAIKIMKELGFEIEVGFIFFDPFAVMEELKQNIDFISETRLYETDSRILGSLRVQEGSPYVLLVKHAKLLNEKNADLLSYSYQFQNEDVADLENIFNQWENATVKLVKLLPVSFRLESYKMNFDFLKELINCYLSNKLIGIKVVAEEYVEKRRRYLSRIRTELDNRIFGVGNRGFIAEYLFFAEEMNNLIIMNGGNSLRTRGKQEHNFLDLHEKARFAWKDSRLIVIAMKADSPNSAENIAKRQKFGRAKRLAVASLTRLRNGYPQKFWTLPEVINAFQQISQVEKKELLAEMPEEISTALMANAKNKQ